MRHQSGTLQMQQWLERKSFLIRRARKRDLGDLSSLIETAFETFRGAVPAHALDRYIGHSMRIGEQANTGDIRVLEADGRVAGCVVYYADASHALDLPKGWAAFRTLAIHPSARGRGFGRELVEYCVDRAWCDGRAAVGLHTGSFMSHALAIYASLGFERVPTFDKKASDVLGFDPALGDIEALAYRLML